MAHKTYKTVSTDGTREISVTVPENEPLHPEYRDAIAGEIRREHNLGKSVAEIALMTNLSSQQVTDLIAKADREYREAQEAGRAFAARQQAASQKADRTRTLNEEEQAEIVNALYTAAATYRDDAKFCMSPAGDNNARVAGMFERQATEAIRLAELLEQAEQIELFS